jgi:DnaJ-class molecular chaperone
MTTGGVSLPDGFAPELCGLCVGRGKGALGPDEPCPPCKGKGVVLVHQPSVKCPRCGGNGRAKTIFDGLTTDPRLCVICQGSGWVMVKFE